MKTKDASRFLAVALSFSVLAVYGCGGGGGGGGGGTTTATGTKSAGTGAAASNNVVSTASTGLSSVANVSGGAPSFKKMGTKEAVSKLYEGLKANQAKVAAMRAGTLKAPVSQNCSVSGTMSMDVTLTGTTITGMTMTFNQCVQTGTTTKTYMDGTMSYSETSTGFIWSMTGIGGTGSFTTRENRISDGLLLSESIMSGSFTGSYGSTFQSCTHSVTGVIYSEPKSITITMNMSGSFKDDFNADGTLDENGTFQMAGFTESVTISTFDSTCDPSAGTLAMSGSMSYTDNIDPNESGSFTIPSTSPLTATWTDATQGTASGTRVSINGTISMTAGCFTGSITFNTTTPLFIPDGKDCPTAGVIVITGDISGTVTYTPTGGVNIDEGSNGTVDYTYTTCEGAQACVG